MDGALQHFYVSQRKCDLMKTISLGLRGSRASCLRENKPALRRHVLKKVRCYGQEAHTDRKGPELYPPPRPAVPRAPGEKEVGLGALALSPNRGGDSQARDCLQMHPGAMGEVH